jgi:signal transduction histidine kinase
MANGILLAVPTTTPTSGAPSTLDTVRALCHDLRQPLAAIRLMAGAQGGDVQRRFVGILEQARWLSDMVEGVIGGAADDHPTTVDVADLTFHCVLRARPTAACNIGFFGTDQSMVVGAPVALSRAVGCLLDNAVRAAGAAGQVIVVVSGTYTDVTIRVIDDGPGLGQVATNNSLGLTIARALVAACEGGFDLQPGIMGGTVAQIVLPAVSCEVLVS